MLRGRRPLLICETAEVAQTLHTVWVDGNRGLMHHPAIQTGWGGGWWTQLVRELDIPVDVTRYKTPRSVDFIDALPRNATGKVLKTDLREPHWQGRDRRVG